MKRSGLLIIFGALFLLLPLNGYFAFGGSPLDPEIEAKIKGQERKIQEAVKSKQMGAEEAKKLQLNLTNIRQQAGSSQSQGKMTVEQKNQFNQILERNSLSIENKKAKSMKAMQQLNRKLPTAQ